MVLLNDDGLIHDKWIISSGVFTILLGFLTVTLEDFAHVNVVDVPAKRFHGLAEVVQPETEYKDGNQVKQRVHERSENGWGGNSIRWIHQKCVSIEAKNRSEAKDIETQIAKD